jgi:hypothetical protein
MPHFGQSPGLSDSTPGHIGQKYFAAAAEGFTIAPPCSWQQQVESPEVESSFIILPARIVRPVIDSEFAEPLLVDFQPA